MEFQKLKDKIHLLIKITTFIFKKQTPFLKIHKS